MKTVVSLRDKLVFEWSGLASLPAGRIVVDLRIRCDGVIERPVVTGRHWIFAAVKEEAGTTEAYCGGRWLALPRSRAFFVPPHAMVRLRLKDVELSARGLIGHGSPPPALASPRSAPFSGEFPSDVSAVAAALEDAILLDPDAEIPPLLKRARQRLYGVLDSRSPVRDVACEVGVAPETLSRKFEAAYGIAPKRYVHAVRVTDAVLSLLGGRGVLSAGLEAGFGDASRFYELFRRVTGN